MREPLCWRGRALRERRVVTAAEVKTLVVRERPTVLVEGIKAAAAAAPAGLILETVARKKAIDAVDTRILYVESRNYGPVPQKFITCSKYSSW